MLPPGSFRLLNPIAPERGKTAYDIPPVITRRPLWPRLRALGGGRRLPLTL